MLTTGGKTVLDKENESVISRRTRDKLSILFSLIFHDHPYKAGNEGALKNKKS